MTTLIKVDKGNDQPLILTDEQIVSLNDTHRNIRLLGYDTKKIYWTKIGSNESVYFKALLFSEEQTKTITKDLIERDKLFDTAPSKFQTEFQNKQITMHFAKVNDGIYVKDAVYIIVDREEGAYDALENFEKHLKNYKPPKTDEMKYIKYTDFTLPGLQECPGRNLDTVYIPKETKDDVMVRIEKFIDDNMVKLYHDHGIPHKKCFLLHGLPGTGKTSFVRAIATHLNYPIYKLHLQLLDDKALLILVNTIPKESIILIEDLDSSFTGMNDPGNARLDPSARAHRGPSFSTILSVLDGITFPEKQIWFITCNDTSILDTPAMRSNRIDHTVLFSQMTASCIQDMLCSFFPDRNEDQERMVQEIAKQLDKKHTASDIQDLIMKEMDLARIHELVTPRKHTTPPRPVMATQQFAQTHQTNRNMFQQHYGTQHGYAAPNGMYL